MSGTLEHVLDDGTMISETTTVDHVTDGGGMVNEGTSNPPIFPVVTRPFLWVDA